jgi:hypothetical protein
MFSQYFIDEDAVESRIPTFVMRRRTRSLRRDHRSPGMASNSDENWLRAATKAYMDKNKFKMVLNAGFSTLKCSFSAAMNLTKLFTFRLDASRTY